MTNGNGTKGPLITQDQWMGFVRQVIPLLSGIAIGKGWLTTDQAANLASLFLQIAGPLGLIAGGVWAYIANNKQSILKAAGKMPEVQKVVVNDAALAAAIPSPKVDTK